MIFDVANAHTFLDAFRFIGDHPGFILGRAWQQLELSGAALGIGAAVALPIGIALGHLHRGANVAIGASIGGRALPIILLIAVLLPVLGIGFVNNMFALAVLATGPLLTNAYGGIEGVEPDAVEAARGMGMSGLQILRRVELPLGLPLIFTGIRIAAVTVVATAPVASIAGGGGLGDVLVNQASYRLDGVIGASYCVMALSAGTWLVLLALEYAMTPEALRGSRVPGTGDLSTKEEL